MPKQFTHLLRVRYADCDAQQVVFNAKYIEYVDVAFTEFMRELFGGYTKLLDRGLDTQVVNINVAWKSSARFDDVIAIGVYCDRVGNTSYTLQLTFTDYTAGTAIATAEAVYVMVTPTEHRKTAIPDDLREILEFGAPDLISDHAGVTEPR